jgi:RHS repeat-associated protein
VLADERGGTVVWALSDNQGTVRDVVDGNGTILNHVVYDSFGKVVSQSNASVEFRYGYTGRDRDTETGLDYYRARYYDSANGRFISEDPIGFAAGDANLTRYVGNSPTNWIDPSGLTPIPVSTSSPSKGRVESYPSRISEPVDNSTLYPSLNRGRLQTGPGYVESFPARQGTPGEFSPNYAVKNKPTTSFSNIQIRTSGSKFEFPPNTTFPGTGTCSIGGQLPPRTRFDDLPQYVFSAGGIGPVLKGRAGVQRAENDLRSQGNTIVENEVTVEAPDGTRTRIDIVIRTPNGDIEFVEVKNGTTADLTTNQRRAFPQIQTQGGTPVGPRAANVPEFTPGQQIGPTRVRVIRY